MSEGREVQWVDIAPEQAGQRIDNFLMTRLKGAPRALIYRIVRKGEVRVNKKRVKVDYRLQTGDLVRVPPLRLAPKEAVKEVSNALKYADDSLQADREVVLEAVKTYGYVLEFADDSLKADR